MSIEERCRSCWLAQWEWLLCGLLSRQSEHSISLAHFFLTPFLPFLDFDFQTFVSFVLVNAVCHLSVASTATYLVVE